MKALFTAAASTIRRRSRGRRDAKRACLPLRSSPRSSTRTACRARRRLREPCRLDSPGRVLARRLDLGAGKVGADIAGQRLAAGAAIDGRAGRRLRTRKLEQRRHLIRHFRGQVAGRVIVADAPAIIRRLLSLGLPGNDNDCEQRQSRGSEAVSHGERIPLRSGHSLARNVTFARRST